MLLQSLTQPWLMEIWLVLSSQVEVIVKGIPCGYLFILYTEGLSTLLFDVELMGDIHGIKGVRGAPWISHLLFVDDSFLFFKATETMSKYQAGSCYL